jgi:hypothetical protein
MTQPPPNNQRPTLRQILDAMTTEERAEAEANLDAYLRTVMNIFERICSDPVAYQQFLGLIGRTDVQNDQSVLPAADQLTTNPQQQ